MRQKSHIWRAFSQILESAQTNNLKHWNSTYQIDEAKPIELGQMLKHWNDKAALKDKAIENIAPLAGSILLSMNKLCQDNNARFSILRIPAQEGFTNPDETAYISTLCKNNKINYLDCTDLFRNHLREDPEKTFSYFVHMNKAGHALVGDQLARSIENGLL